MNLQSMDYMITTAQEKSITRAAAKLHITQQTLSAHIAAVEQELGCQLFVRHQPLEITYAGEEFLRYAEAIQQQIQGLRRTFDEIAGEEKGLLKVGVTDNRDRIVLLPIVVRFQQDHPKIELKVIEAPNETLIQKLSKGELDVCISDFATRQSGIHQMNLYRERVVFVVDKMLFGRVYGEKADEVMEAVQRKADYRPLQICPLLFGHEEDISGRFSRRVIETFERRPVVRVEAENMAFVLGLCAHGLGGCFCPEIIVRNTLTPRQMENMLVLTLGPAAEYTIRIGWKNPWKVIDAFVAAAQQEARAFSGSSANGVGRNAARDL